MRADVDPLSMRYGPPRFAWPATHARRSNVAVARRCLRDGLAAVGVCRGQVLNVAAAARCPGSRRSAVRCRTRSRHLHHGGAWPKFHCLTHLARAVSGACVQSTRHHSGQGLGRGLAVSSHAPYASRAYRVTDLPSASRAMHHPENFGNGRVSCAVPPVRCRLPAAPDRAHVATHHIQNVIISTIASPSLWRAILNVSMCNYVLPFGRAERLPVSVGCTVRETRLLIAAPLTAPWR